MWRHLPAATLAFGLVLFEICLILLISVLRTASFQVLWHFSSFNLLLKAYCACYYENLLILGLFFRICFPTFLFPFVADFSFCWIFLPRQVGLVFCWNYLLLACFSNLLASFWKITLHHWIASTSKLFSLKTTKCHAHVAHMAKHMNMVGGSGPGPLGQVWNACPT